MYTWIDASYAVQIYMRSHTGGGIFMVYVVLHKKAPVQKLNTKISVEADIVGVSEYISYSVWLMIF